MIRIDLKCSVTVSWWIGGYRNNPKVKELAVAAKPEASNLKLPPNIFISPSPIPLNKFSEEDISSIVSEETSKPVVSEMNVKDGWSKTTK